MELPDPVRERLGNFSRSLFTDTNRTGPENNSNLNNEIVSSLALQMSLYFNIYFFPFWWVSSIIMLLLKVPELAGFWLLSFLLQLPLILFLLFNEGLKSQPLERAVHIIFTIFLTLQVVLAFFTLKKMANHLAASFQLQDFDRFDQFSSRDMIRAKSKTQIPRFSDPLL
ncbi:transmembrane protein 17 isoform X2 [Monodelphis domestica]|uniref:transmembrane protein 17 isoform X2 n=1 Tax=Monodelphis domestica TaxID=13616 RepID=UPI00044311E5|nr:transmembrane protein 17 isoform X2 [Monodelphis domestica]